MTLVRRLARLIRFDPLEVEGLAERTGAHQAALESAQETLGSLDERLGNAERRLDRLEGGVGQLDERLAQLTDRLDRRLDELRNAIDDGLAETRASAEQDVAGLSRELESAQDRLSSAVREVIGDLEQLRAGVRGDMDATRHATEAVQRRLDGLEGDQRDASAELERVRDRMLPAAVERSNVLIDRLCEELEELGSLVERILLREPLPAPRADPDTEPALAVGLSEVQELLLDRFRGDREEILHRQGWYAELLETHAPVLDLGCGRGELLELLRARGIEAVGIESDPAVAGGAERRGLRVVSCDVLEYLREQPDESWGAVVALHLLEHLAPAELQQCLAEVRRVLRPGGLLAAECPNPYSLRVGGTLFWIDPTHRRPLLPDTLELFMLAAGLQPEAPHWRHPFPEEQRLMPSLPEGESPEMVQLCGAVGELADRLDELLNGYRDYVLVAHRPEAVEVERNASEARSTGRTL